jgi:acetyltransferase-like isoleucine patch superfamily enzyme
MMKMFQKLRRGEGPVWGRLKSAARRILSFHLPVNSVTRPAFRILYVAHVAAREWIIATRRFIWDEPLFRSQCVVVGTGFWMEQLPYLQGHGRITIGNQVRFSGKPQIAFNNRYDDGPALTIDDGTFIGHLCDFRIASSIRIGRNCLLAGGVTIADYDGHPFDAAARRAGATSPLSAVRPVTIGDDVWIGSGATILKGVTIGDRSVVGAQAVVTRDVPPDCVVAGNPASVVRELISPDRASSQLAPTTSRQYT